MHKSRSRFQRELLEPREQYARDLLDVRIGQHAELRPIAGEFLKPLPDVPPVGPDDFFIVGTSPADVVTAEQDAAIARYPDLDEVYTVYGGNLKDGKLYWLLRLGRSQPEVVNVTERFPVGIEAWIGFNKAPELIPGVERLDEQLGIVRALVTTIKELRPTKLRYVDTTTNLSTIPVYGEAIARATL